MRFCSICSNMCYIKLKDDDSGEDCLEYYCRQCGTIEAATSEENAYICAYKVQLKKGEKSFHHIINKYTKLDPTLPRMSTMVCPNAMCATNAAAAAAAAEDATAVDLEETGETVPREIVYIRYDDVNMKYMYLCCTCDHVWNISKSFHAPF